MVDESDYIQLEFPFLTFLFCFLNPSFMMHSVIPFCFTLIGQFQFARELCTAALVTPPPLQPKLIMELGGGGAPLCCFSLPPPPRFCYIIKQEIHVYI